MDLITSQESERNDVHCTALSIIFENAEHFFLPVDFQQENSDTWAQYFIFLFTNLIKYEYIFDCYSII